MPSSSSVVIAFASPLPLTTLTCVEAAFFPFSTLAWQFRNFAGRRAAAAAALSPPPPPDQASLENPLHRPWADCINGLWWRRRKGSYEEGGGVSSSPFVSSGKFLCRIGFGVSFPLLPDDLLLSTAAEIRIKSPSSSNLAFNVGCLGSAYCQVLYIAYRKHSKEREGAGWRRRGP